MVRCFRVLGLSSLLAAVATVGAAQEPGRPAPPPPPDRPVIVASGSAIVRLPPDRAFVTLATETLAQRPADAQQRNAQSMTAVRAALKNARVPDDAVRTLSYSLNEEVEFPDGKRVSRGYRATNLIEVRLDDVTRVGEVIDAAVQSGAARVNDIRFDLKNREGAERDALRQAVADARARADAMAAGANVSIGTVLRVEEQGAGPMPPPQPMRMNMAVAHDAAAPTPVSAGELEISAAVTLTASIR